MLQGVQSQTSHLFGCVVALQFGGESVAKLMQTQSSDQNHGHEQKPKEVRRLGKQIFEHVISISRALSIVWDTVLSQTGGRVGKSLFRSKADGRCASSGQLHRCF